jgi:hypothetical protein
MARPVEDGDTLRHNSLSSAVAASSMLFYL